MNLGLTMGLTSPLCGPGRGALGLFAGGKSGFFHDFANTSRLFQVSDGTTEVAVDGDPVGWAKSADPTERVATSATSNARGAWKTGGSVLFDASNDTLLTTFTPTGHGNTLAAKVTVPASIAAAQIVIGASTASRLYLGFRTDGYLMGGVGSQASTTIFSAVDLRGQTGIAHLVEGASLVKLYWNGAEVYSGATVGNMPNIPHRIGSQNNSGSPGSFFGGRIFKAFAADYAATPEQVAAMVAAWT